MHALTRRLMLTTTIGGAIAAATPLSAQTSASTAPANTEWPTYGGDLAATRYMPLDQINATNFNTLEVAWTFKTENLGGRPEFNLQCTPLLIKGRLYATAGSRRDVVCIDAATGEMLWMHRMEEGRRASVAPRQLSGRGVAYWTDGTAERILYVTIGYHMVSLDAKTGLVDESFGDKGVVDLKTQIDQDLDLENADIGLHTAPLVVRDTIVIGAAHTAGNTPKIIRNARGYVRAFDVRTGKRKWIFHTIPHKGEFGYDTWLKEGSAEMAGNTGSWAQMSADPEMGLVYFGVEMPTGDQMGFYRPGNNLFAESIVAVDIETGVRKWHYQMLHHGLWDYDVPCAAILCDIPHKGRIIKALAQPTKQCFLFVLDRATGKPVWPIPEKKVIPGDVPGEWYSPTQPIPSAPPAFDKQGITRDDLIDWTPELRKKAEAIASHYVMAPIYTAPIMPRKGGPYGVLNMPGYIGGINWPGASYDPNNYTIYTYSQTNLLTLGVIIPNPDKKMGEFDYVHVNPPPDSPDFRPGNTDVDGLPLIKPPYGRITATNLATGKQDWQVAHGETPDAIRNHPALKGLKIPRTGMMGKVGPLATKALVVCGDPESYTDETGRFGARLRAYSKTDGAEVGAVFIPAPQTGSPMTYMLNGKQYILVAVGGRGQKAQFMAFRLPSA